MDEDRLNEIVGQALERMGLFDSVEIVPGAVYVTKNGRTFAVSTIECEEN